MLTHYCTLFYRIATGFSTGVILGKDENNNLW